MKHKIAALLIVLAFNGFIGSNEANVSYSTDPNENVENVDKTIPSIVIPQLEQLLKELEHDENIVEFLEKYPNAIKYFGEKERKKVKKIAEKIALINNADPIEIESGIYKTIKHESNFNPKAVNKLSNASGIIQWLPSTARCYNTSVKDILTMSVLEQLDYVDLYLTNCANKYTITTSLDIYLAVFNPSSIGKSNDSVIGKKGSTAAIQNAGVDKAGDNDGILEVSDVKEWLS